MKLLSKVFNFVKNNDDEQAYQAIVKKGLLPQHEYLISQGFTSPLRNLKALLKSKGEPQQAIMFLVNREEKHNERMASKLEKIENFKSRRENRQLNKLESKKEKYERKLPNVQQQIVAYNWNTQMDILEKQGFNHRVKVFKVLNKCKGDVNSAFVVIQQKSRKNPNIFKLPNWDEAGKGSVIMQSNISSSFPLQQVPYQQGNQQIQFSQPLQKEGQLNSNIKKEDKVMIIPEGMDADAFMQMVRSQEERKEDKEEQPSREQEFSDQNLEQYIKKNQFLIANGFTNAKTNIKTLVRCNGNEQQALLELTQGQLSKININNNLPNQAKNDKDSDDSSDSDY